MKIHAFLTAGMLCLFGIAHGQKISFEIDSNTTAVYSDVIQFYEELDAKYEEAKLVKAGKTDSGRPLHTFIISKNQYFTPEEAKRAGKTVLLINNGIHPGEPEGIDASMMLARDLLKSGDWNENLVICIIPVYNIGGMLIRGTSRANQNGPNEYGYRGNANNYDLNRDFIKTDTRNSHSFQEIFNAWDPDVFMDTHTSNGADYQYVMTLIETQIDKLHPSLQESANSLTQQLYAQMEVVGYEMVPYVTFRGRNPESGIVSFMESPRYSTGYASLKHTIGYMPETHMWKPYHDRVKSTYQLLKALIRSTGELGPEIRQSRLKLKEEIQKQNTFTLSWSLDTTRHEMLNFKGYTSGTKKSDIHGQDRMFYDRNQPFTKEIKYFRHYKPNIQVEKPKAYYIPQSWVRVLDLLKLNGVVMEEVQEDQVMVMERYRILSYQTSSQPSEGHYPHSQVKLEKMMDTVQVFKGDYIVSTSQPQVRYIIETLEPEAVDSFFNWNFFDSILSRKEYYSAYIFEDYAFQMLNQNSSLKKEFEKLKSEDSKFASDSRMQLEWLFNKSPFYSDIPMKYPIGRIIN